MKEKGLALGHKVGDRTSDPRSETDLPLDRLLFLWALVFSFEK